MSGQRASERLRATLAQALPLLQAAAARLWAGPQARERYPVYLRAMHAVVRSAVPLMEAATARARELAPHDDVAAGLVDYLAHHVTEEAGHDRWLLEDLAACGGDPQEPLRRIPPVSIAQLVGAQYYWLRHHHPVALLGHIAAIEGNHPPPGFAARLQALTGHPPEAFRAIARHERLDVRHARELYEAIDRLPLRPEHEAVVGVSGLHTLCAAAEVLDEVAAATNVPAPAGAGDHEQGGSEWHRMRDTWRR